ncbi:MAG: dephospho-CoA kinase [Bryobacteraceae bacterium]|nr:dephospho-CoA kinase [Bryobacteraceae bacterium]
MLRVGLTGGLATGKSFVGQALVKLGCHLLQADHLGHAVLAPDGEAYQAVIDAFGRQILNDDGQINRKRLGEIVFANPAELARLNALVHPAVFARQEAWFASRPPGAIAIIEAAIMVETGSYRRYHCLILTVCRPELQIARAMARDGLTEAQVRDRLARQLPESEKRKHAHFVIDTSLSEEDTLAQTAQVCAQLKRRAL